MKDAFILVAEDDADGRFLLQTAFHEKGYSKRIEFAEDGIELINYLQNISLKETSKSSFPGFYPNGRRTEEKRCKN